MHVWPELGVVEDGMGGVEDEDEDAEELPIAADDMRVVIEADVALVVTVVKLNNVDMMLVVGEGDEVDEVALVVTVVKLDDVAMVLVVV